MMEYAGKKVLIIVENLPVPFDRRVWQEALAIKEKGAEVNIICPILKGYTKKYEELEGIRIYRHGLWIEARRKPEYLFEYLSAFFSESYLAWKIFFKHGIDVIHACNPPDFIFLVALPFKLLGKKFLFDHHDINPELYIAKYNRKDIFYRSLLLIERLTFKTANYSIATNNSYKEIAVNRGGMDPVNVTIVRSGPDLNRLKHYPPDDKYKSGKKYLVGYVGVIGKQEGLNNLIEAITYIVFNRGRKDIHFVCIGRGPDLENIQKSAEENRISDYITFTGRIPDEEMIPILNTADVCINADDYNEMNDKSTMNKIMEYMALKKPIVQFELKEGRYTAQKASIYADQSDSIDFAEKIMELIDNPQKRKEMGEFGYNRIRNELSWEFEKKNLYEVYDKLLLDDGRQSV